jgi:CBS domain-containing protein
MATVADWMTAPVKAIEPYATVGDAYDRMKRHGIRRLPVVGEDGVLLGIVTLGDLREARPSPGATLSIYEMNYLLSRLTVQSVMTHNPYTVAPEAPVQRAAQIMLDRTVSGLPVVQPNGAIVGIITESDIFRKLVERWAVLTGQFERYGFAASRPANEPN